VFRDSSAVQLLHMSGANLGANLPVPRLSVADARSHFKNFRTKAHKAKTPR